jgi:hypothetical protein
MMESPEASVIENCVGPYPAELVLSNMSSSILLSLSHIISLYSPFFTNILDISCTTFPRTLNILIETSGSHGGEYKNECLFGCCAVQSDRNLRAF